jgi:hypothetical protein
MSIAVPLDELAGEVARRDFAYLLTVDADGRARVLALVPEFVDGTFRFGVGRAAPSSGYVLTHRCRWCSHRRATTT